MAVTGSAAQFVLARRIGDQKLAGFGRAPGGGVFLNGLLVQSREPRGQATLALVAAVIADRHFDGAFLAD